MKVLTVNLEGPALNWAVGHAVGYDYDIVDGAPVTGGQVISDDGLVFDEVWEPSANPSHGWPFIDSEKISVIEYNGTWKARKSRAGNYDAVGAGETSLLAAMRCLVYAKCGREVEVPDALA